jgi:hypothetical protein
VTAPNLFLQFIHALFQITQANEIRGAIHAALA